MLSVTILSCKKNTKKSYKSNKINLCAQGYMVEKLFTDKKYKSSYNTYNILH